MMAKRCSQRDDQKQAWPGKLSAQQFLGGFAFNQATPVAGKRRLALAIYDAAAFALVKTMPLASLPTAVKTAIMIATEPATTASASP